MKTSRVKCLLRAMGLLLALSSLAMAAPAGGRGEGGSRVVNLVRNPGFEQPDTANPGLPAGFAPGCVGKDSEVKLTWEEPGGTGKKAVAIETTSSSGLGYWETTIPVQPLTEYTLSFSYKCRSAAVPQATTGDPLYNRSRPGGPNLELGVITEDKSQMGPPTSWSDIGISLGPVGGTYLPLAT